MVTKDSKIITIKEVYDVHSEATREKFMERRRPQRNWHYFKEEGLAAARS